MERLRNEAPPEQVKRLLTSAFILTGMRVDVPTTRNLFRGARTTQESSTYQWILEEGGIREARKIVLRLGRQRFGDPELESRNAFDAIEDLERLERMIEWVFRVSGWPELLQTP